MPIDYPAILALSFPEERWSWSEDQVILYALAVGVPPLSADPAESVLIHRRLGPDVLPSFMSVAGASGQLGARRLGIDRRRRLHGDQSLILHAPVPASGTAVTRASIEQCWDKGDRGAAIISRADTFDANGRPLATSRMTSFARGEGHFGGPRGHSEAPSLPLRAPDATIDVAVSPYNAALFALIRDRNPLHTDPEAAALAGFDRPVVHGLCLFGMACRLATTRIEPLRGLRMVEQHVRFAAPAHPGDQLTFAFWLESDLVRFGADAGERKILTHGRMRFVAADYGASAL